MTDRDLLEERARWRRFLRNPRAMLAGSSSAPLVWLSYIAPRHLGFGSKSSSHLKNFGDEVSDRPVTVSRKLSLRPSLAAFLGARLEWLWPRETRSDQTIVGWGYRKSGRKAAARAKKIGARVLLLEDGFLRSVERSGPEVSVNFDANGIHYDSASASRLFDLIRHPLTETQTKRARNIAALWRAHGLSKYNAGRAHPDRLPARYVLVIDQVRADLSISYGRADATSFASMLQGALDYDPDATVIVKMHPDSAGKPSKRHFDVSQLRSHPRIQVIDDNSHVAPMIAEAEAVFCVTSQVGFEALIYGKPVHVYGMPFYAGWGLTFDRLQPPDDRCSVTIDQLVHAALIDYPRYWNPVSQKECSPEEAMDLVGLNLAERNKYSEAVYAVGFSPWKRGFVSDFLAGSRVSFVSHASDIPKGSTAVLWGRHSGVESDRRCDILRMEDGFLRSSGLGANLVRPLSLVIDDQGIYYDASGPSRLEEILSTHDYSEDERVRAKRLREAIVSARINKYNLGGQAWTRPETDRTIVLVVGQVEEDASIEFGSPELKSNESLLRRVRKERPDAYIVYKPHPDVLAGLRKAGTDLTGGDMPYDEIVEDADPSALLDSVDEVHTMTSLMGFEALMRGVPVTCHGLPFYAGWGLTDDRVACERRGRARTIDELVHAALIDYPRYFSPRGRMFARPEDILVELADLARAGPARRSLPRRVLFWIVTRWVKLRGRK